MRNVCVTLLALAFASIALDTAAAEEGAKVDRWRVGYYAEYWSPFGAIGGSVVHGPEVSYAVVPRLRVGGGLHFPLIALSPESCGIVEEGFGPCSFNSYGMRGFAEFHPFPRFPVDPWIGAGLLALIHTSRYTFATAEMAEPDHGAFTFAGVDVHAGSVYLNAHVILAAFVGEQANILGGGIRIGGHL